MSLCDAVDSEFRITEASGIVLWFDVSRALSPLDRRVRKQPERASRDYSWPPHGDITVPQTNPTRKRGQGVMKTSLALRVGVRP